jgi:hypothetical protein
MRGNEGRVVLIDDAIEQRGPARVPAQDLRRRPANPRIPIAKRLPVSGGEVHVTTDLGSSAYRRYLRERGITFGVC